MFKQKIKSFLITLANVIKTNPMESIIAFIAVVIAILEIHGGVFPKFSTEEDMYYKNYRLSYFPIVFLLTNIIHYHTKNKWIYFTITALLLLLMIFNIKPNSTYYIVGLSSTILAYLCHKLYKENKQLANSVVNIVVALILASFVAGITNGLIVSIKASINYLFDLDRSWKDIEYLSSIIWLGFFPMLFLAFNNNSLKLNLKNRFTDILFNFILTPAIIIYTLIFYIYSLKIIIQWELPLGNVAYMVFGFGIGAYILKMLSYLFVKEYFTWLYKKLSYFLLPALVLFWIGTMYRINQYGFTEGRIYLFLGGLYLSCVSLILLNEKWGRFLYISLGIIAVLSVFTYIPFMSAKKLGLVAQEYRFEQAIKSLGYSKIDSTITMKILDTTVENKKALKILVSSFKYISHETDEKYITKKYAITSSYQLEKIITEENYKMVYGNDGYGEETNYSGLDLFYTDRRDIDVKGYKLFKPISSYETQNLYWFSNDDISRFIIYGKDSTIVFSANKDSLFLAQLKKVSISLNDVFKNGNHSFTTKEKEKFFCIETSTQKILIENYTYKKDSFKVKNIEPYAILLK